MPVLRCAPSCHVEFNATPLSGVPLKPAGFRILCELCNMAKDWYQDLEVTSGSEGQHSGPTDPHKRGEAIDLRSNNMASLAEKQGFVQSLIIRLCDKVGERVFEVSGGWANDHFFAFLEDAGKPNEHIHIQRRHNTAYP